MSDRPNILFIVIDQFRADCLHGVLDTAVDLPNLRAFAAESVSFRQNRSVVNPCGPSRASLLTGQYAMNHRAVRNGPPIPPTLPPRSARRAICRCCSAIPIAPATRATWPPATRR